MDSLRIIPPSTFVWKRKFKEINSVRWVGSRLPFVLTTSTTASRYQSPHTYVALHTLVTLKLNVRFMMDDASSSSSLVHFDPICVELKTLPPVACTTIGKMRNGNLLPFQFYTDSPESVLIWLRASDCTISGHVTTPHGSLYQYQSIVWRFYQSEKSICNIVFGEMRCVKFGHARSVHSAHSHTHMHHSDGRVESMYHATEVSALCAQLILRCAFIKLMAFLPFARNTLAHLNY